MQECSMGGCWILLNQKQANQLIIIYVGKMHKVTLLQQFHLHKDEKKMSGPGP